VTTIILPDDDSPTTPHERPSRERVSRHSLVHCAIPVLPPEQSGAATTHGASDGKIHPGQFTRSAPVGSFWRRIREAIWPRESMERPITFAELRVVEAAMREHQTKRAWWQAERETGEMTAWKGAQAELEHACVALEKERGQ
jgi:hypothetical protein